SAGKLAFRFKPPFPVPTNSFLPSADTAIALGYHAVGIKPRTTDSFGFEVSMTATSLLSAFATYTRLPSAVTPRAHGVEPTSAFGSNEVLIVSINLPSRITLTLFEPAFATNSRPSELNARSFGWLSTLTREDSAKAFVSRMLIDSSPQF